MSTLNTTSITRCTNNDGSETLLVSVNGGAPEEITEERCSLIIEQRIAAGWKVWRDKRDSDGRVLDVLFTMNA